MLYSAASRIRIVMSGKQAGIRLALGLVAVAALGLTAIFAAQAAASGGANGGHPGQGVNLGRAKKSATPTAVPAPATATAASATSTSAVAASTATPTPPAVVPSPPPAPSPPAPPATATATLAAPIPIATAQAPGSPRILFGVGPEGDAAKSSPLNQAAPLGMYSNWYNGTKDLAWMQYWYTSGFIRNSIYGTGRAAHLIIWSDGPNATSPVCGRPYPVSTQILADMQTLATYWAGSANGPPLYVTLFTEFQTYPCIEDQWAGAEEYYGLLKQRMLQIRDIFHQYAPNSRVSIGWGGWQTRWNNSTTGAGASLIPYFADVMGQMDFQSTQLMNNDTNVADAQRMVTALGQYGPVMVAHYRPENLSNTTFYADISAIMTSSFLSGLVSHGLFAWSFMDQANFNDMTDPAEVANFNLVLNAVRAFGRAP